MQKKTGNSRFSKRFLLILVVGLAALLLGLAVILYFAANLRSSLLNLAPEYSATQLYTKATEQIDKGDYKEAEAYLEQALQKEASNDYRSQLAVVKYRLKKYDESIEQYQLMIDQKKDLAFAWNGVGNAYRDWAGTVPAKLGEYQGRAEAAYRSAFAADPNYTAAYSNLGLLLASEGRRTEALQVLDLGISRTKRNELEVLKKRI